MPHNLKEKLTTENYWKQRCQAAEEYIRHTPMLPHANEDQTFFEDRWKAIKMMEYLIAPKERKI